MARVQEQYHGYEALESQGYIHSLQIFILFYSIPGFTVTGTEALQQILVFKWICFTTWMLKSPEMLLLLIMRYLQGMIKVCLSGEIY